MPSVAKENIFYILLTVDFFVVNIFCIFIYESHKENNNVQLYTLNLQLEKKKNKQNGLKFVRLVFCFFSEMLNTSTPSTQICSGTLIPYVWNLSTFLNLIYHNVSQIGKYCMLWCKPKYNPDLLGVDYVMTGWLRLKLGYFNSPLWTPSWQCHITSYVYKESKTRPHF